MAMKKLPYRARTQTGDIFDIEFPLHEDTGDAVRVGQLISIILESIDRDLGVGGDMNNGDVLQSLAMVMAIRTGMIYAPRDMTGKLAKDLLAEALEAFSRSNHSAPQSGHA